MGVQLRDPKIQKILMVGILGLAALYVYFLTDLAPFTFKASARELKGLSDEYQRLSGDLTKARQSVNSLPYLEREYNLLHIKWTEAQRLLPDDQETASFLRALSLLGDQAGVEFVLFRPLAPRPAQYHTEHAVELKVEGGYHEVGAFLGELANMERIVTIADLTIESIKEPDSKNTAVASFVAKTYTQGGTGVPPEQAAEGEKKVGEKKPAVLQVVKDAKKLGQKLAAKQKGAPSDE